MGSVESVWDSLKPAQPLLSLSLVAVHQSCSLVFPCSIPGSASSVALLSLFILVGILGRTALLPMLTILRNLIEDHSSARCVRFYPRFNTSSALFERIEQGNCVERMGRTNLSLRLCRHHLSEKHVLTRSNPTTRV